MKKAYQKPNIEVTEFHFSEHIAASGGDVTCYWGTYATHASPGCTEIPDGAGGYINNTGN
jgi:hypothetical protein